MSIAAPIARASRCAGVTPAHCKMRGRTSGVLFAVFTSFLACAAFPPSSGEPSAAKARETAYRVAIAPVTLAIDVERRSATDPTRYADAATHVGHYLAEALLERGFEVVPAHDSMDVLADLPRTPDFHRDASRLTRAAVERLDVDALLLVEVTRWEQRNALQRRPTPTAVGFRATLHKGSNGFLLWSGAFSERQVSFFESPWRSLQYPGMSTRWLSATELARWGARSLVDQLPISSVEQ